MAHKPPAAHKPHAAQPKHAAPPHDKHGTVNQKGATPGVPAAGGTPPHQPIARDMRKHSGGN